MTRFSLTLSLILIFVFGAHPAASQSDAVSDVLVPLSSREADAIIQKEADAKADEKARRRAHLLDQSTFPVVEKKEISTGQKKLTFNRVETPLFNPPVSQSQVTELLQPKKQPSKAEIEQILASSNKEQGTLMLSATVYDRKLTRLQWQHEGQQYIAWSNIDFNYLRGLNEIETKKTNYLFFLGIGNESTERLKERNRLAKEMGVDGYVEESIPELPDLKENKSDYVIVTPGRSEKRQKDALIPVDALHKYYTENEERLKVQHQRNEALNDARKRYKDKNPEEPEDIFINFWPVRSSVQKKPSDKI